MLSVIVPVYKVEKYLQKCIESILTQTYNNIEIILVDDGSPDSCPQICDTFSKVDPRIKVVHKKNGGLSSARNCGLKVARGEYVTFVDSDDTINPMAFERMMNVMCTCSADICMCSSQTVTDSGSILATDSFVEETLYQGETLFRNIVLPLKTASWSKIFKRVLIGESLFPEDKIHGEDLVFFLEVINENTKLVTTEYIGYNYFKRCNSITTSAFNRHSLDEVWCKDKAAELVKMKFPIYDRMSLLWCFRARLNLLRKLISQEENYVEIIKTYTENLRDMYMDIRDIMPLKMKIEYMLFVHSKKNFIRLFSNR